VTVCDLDIVNPYFRAADAREFLKQKDIGLISSDYANTNLEAPSVSPEAQAAFDDAGLYAVIDLGGDDRGALALGRYAKYLNLAAGQDAEYEMLLVANRCRPLTRDAGSLLEIKDGIERASRTKFTGLVNNTNLGAKTTPEDIIDSLGFALELEIVLGLPLKMTAVNAALISPELTDFWENHAEVFPVRPHRTFAFPI
jgi:hypothetical protein